MTVIVFGSRPGLHSYFLCHSRDLHPLRYSGAHAARTSGQPNRDSGRVGHSSAQHVPGHAAIRHGSRAPSFKDTACAPNCNAPRDGRSSETQRACDGLLCCSAQAGGITTGFGWHWSAGPAGRPGPLRRLAQRRRRSGWQRRSLRGSWRAPWSWCAAAALLPCHANWRQKNRLPVRARSNRVAQLTDSDQRWAAVTLTTGTRPLPRAGTHAPQFFSGSAPM